MPVEERMGKEFVSLSFLLLLLLLVLHGTGNAAAGVAPDVLRLPGDQDDHVKHGDGHGHSSSHMGMGMAMAMGHGMVNPSSIMVFFRKKDLKVGNRIPTYLPRKDTSNAFNFLPRRQADSIPFSSKALPYLLKRFSLSPDSYQAKAMVETLKVCEAEPVKGEIPHCATSRESLLDFAHSIVGSPLQMLTTSTNAPALLQNYTVLQQPNEIKAPKMVACHGMSYPYTVFFCHYPGDETKVSTVSLSADNGDRVDAVTVCHFDTSHWDPDHVSFRVLGVKPGTSEVCHFLPADHFMLINPHLS